MLPLNLERVETSGDALMPTAAMSEPQQSHEENERASERQFKLDNDSGVITRPSPSALAWQVWGLKEGG